MASQPGVGVASIGNSFVCLQSAGMGSDGGTMGLMMNCSFGFLGPGGERAEGLEALEGGGLKGGSEPILWTLGTFS